MHSDGDDGQNDLLQIPLHGHITSAQAFQITCIFPPICIQFVCHCFCPSCSWRARECVGSCQKIFWTKRSLADNADEFFFFLKKVGVVLRTHHHYTAECFLDITNVAIFFVIITSVMQKGPARHSGEPQGARGGDGEV